MDGPILPYEIDIQKYISQDNYLLGVYISFSQAIPTIQSSVIAQGIQPKERGAMPFVLRKIVTVCQQMR